MQRLHKGGQQAADTTPTPSQHNFPGIGVERLVWGQVQVMPVSSADSTETLWGIAEALLRILKGITLLTLLYPRLPVSLGMCHHTSTTGRARSGSQAGGGTDPVDLLSPTSVNLIHSAVTGGKHGGGVAEH